MIIPIINLAVFIVIVAIAFIRLRMKVNFYNVNIILLISYNYIGWAYILKYLDVGGASLGAGLFIMLISGVHAFLLFIIGVIHLSIRSVRQKH